MFRLVLTLWLNLSSYYTGIPWNIYGWNGMLNIYFNSNDIRLGEKTDYELEVTHLRIPCIIVLFFWYVWSFLWTIVPKNYPEEWNILVCPSVRLLFISVSLMFWKEPDWMVGTWQMRCESWSVGYLLMHAHHSLLILCISKHMPFSPIEQDAIVIMQNENEQNEIQSKFRAKWNSA